MTDTTYNGWTNRETWLVVVWFNPETLDDINSAEDYLNEQVAALPDLMRDFCSISEINWEELRAHFSEDGDGE